MLFKIASFATIALLAVATPAVAQSCSTGSAECCDSVGKATDEPFAGVLGSIGIVAQGITVPVGLTCTPITVVGVSGTDCSAQAVCCDDVKESGLVAIGCTPIDASL